MADERKHSLQQAATGAALVGAGSGLKAGLDYRIRRSGQVAAPRAAARTTAHQVKRAHAAAFHRPAPGKTVGGWKGHVHAPDLAGRSVGRSLQAVGLPLAAYGAVNALRKKPAKVKPVDRATLARNVARSSVGLPHVEAGEAQMAADDDHFLVVHKDQAKNEAHSYLRSLPPGRHRVQPEKIDAGIAGSGLRLHDRAYVARMAASPGQIRGATRFAVHPDGTVRQIDGAHRYAARNMRGTSRVPIEIEHSQERARSKGAKVVYRPAKAKLQRGQRKRDRAMDPAKMHALAASYPTWADPVNQKLSSVGKLLTRSEQRKLDAHRRVGRATSLVGGTLGLGALALRAPSGAALIARRAPSLVRPSAALNAKNASRAAFGRKPLKRPLAAVADLGDAATKHSNTLGVGAIGTGAIGSFNYAAQQKLERKATKPVVKRDNRRATGGAIVGTGATVGALGLAGGGIPGAKSTRIGSDILSAPGVRGKARNAGRAYAGGEFGNRVNAHQTHKIFSLGGDREGESLAHHFQYGQKVGASHTEDKVIRHLKTGRAASNLALASGVGITAYGVHRLRGRRGVAKARHEAAYGALAAGGATAAGVGYGGARLAEHQGREWSKRAVRDLNAASKIAPKAGGHIMNPYPDKVKNWRVPDIGPKVQGSKIAKDPTILAGKTPAQAHAVGELRGAATKHRYFAGVYGTAGKWSRRGGRAGAATAALGVGGLALNRRREPVAKREPRDDKFLRGYKTRISPDAESGYRTLKRGRNAQTTQAAGAAAMAGLGGWLTHHELTHKPVAKPAALIAGAGTVASMMSTAQNAGSARRYQEKMNKIKAKGRSRRAQGLYGPGRGLDPVDTTSRNHRVSKAEEALMHDVATNLAQAYAVNKGFGGGKLLRRAAKPVAEVAKPQTYVSRASRPLNPNSSEARHRAAMTARQDASLARLDRGNAERKVQETRVHKPVEPNYQPYAGSYGLRPR